MRHDLSYFYIFFLELKLLTAPIWFNFHTFSTFVVWSRICHWKTGYPGKFSPNQKEMTCSLWSPVLRRQWQLSMDRHVQRVAKALLSAISRELFLLESWFMTPKMLVISPPVMGTSPKSRLCSTNPWIQTRDPKWQLKGLTQPKCV